MPENWLESIGDIFVNPTTWVAEPGVWLGGLSWSPRLNRRIQADITAFDIVHNHSVWMLPNHYASNAGQIAKKPVVFTLHGCFEPWAMANSAWKKSVVGKWFQFGDLKAAECLHVNSKSEYSNVRRLGFKNPIAIIPNGVKLANFRGNAKDPSFHARLNIPPEKKIALFMARLHQKKGLSHLLEAWNKIRSDFENWHLVLAGPDDGYKVTCESMIDGFAMRNSVTLTGNLQGADRVAALSSADVFVQPSHSEGFSMSILEAMTFGLPVLLSPGCNFPEAVANGAALEVKATVEATENGLRTLLGMSKEERFSMGKHGESLVIKNYTWEKIGTQTLELYKWLTGAGPQPPFVERG